jgi:SAM-dependent methyltransferase
MDSDAWDARYAATELLWSAEPSRFLVAQVSDLAPGRALDVACGEGRNAIWLAEHGWEVTGVDFSPVALDKARRLADGRGVTVRWLLADAVTDALEPAAFDLVAVFYLQLPSEQRRAAFAAAARAVAPGGTLLVVGHDTTNLTNGWGGPRDATVLYSPDDVAADIDYLEVVKAERVERPVLTEEGPKIAIDVLVRAIRPA